MARTDPHTANWSNTACDDPGDSLIGMQADLSVGFAPHQPDRQAGAQLAAGGLVADPTGQPGPQHVQLSLAEHVPFMPSSSRSLNNPG